jgi:hypothetical protein
VNSRAAFIKAERTRRQRRPASARQRRKLHALARQAGVEMPRVFWSCDASDAITRLEQYLAQPMLEGFSG